MQQLLRKLEAVHSYSGPDAPDHPSETAVHPVVRRHPETGEEGIYLNRMFATRFVGMTKEESEPLLKFLDEHMTRCEFTARISWTEGQLVRITGLRFITRLMISRAIDGCCTAAL